MQSTSYLRQFCGIFSYENSRQAFIPEPGFLSVEELALPDATVLGGLAGSGGGPEVPRPQHADRGGGLGLELGIA